MNELTGNARRRLLLIAPACDGEDVGESWVAYQWVRRLADCNEVTLLTTFKRGHTPMSLQLPDIRVIEWPEPHGLGRLERLNSLMQPGYIPFYHRARGWLRRDAAQGGKIDLIHQIVPVAMRYPCPAIGLGIPFILGPVGGSLESPTAFVSEEGATPWWQKLRRFDRWRILHDPLLRRTYEQAACVIGVADYVSEFLSGVAVNRFETMSETAVDRMPDPVDRNPRGPEVRLLYVGRIIRTKGLRDLIRALAQLTDLPVVLDVVGEGNDREACERLTTELQLADRVVFHGQLPRTCVNRFYEEADVFVFPSYREPGGNVALEAMAHGLPLVVCRRGGPGANVDDSCALLLDAVSPDQLATDCALAIRMLVTNRALRLRMGGAARERALTRHLWSQRVTRMAKLYDEIVPASAAP